MGEDFYHRQKRVEQDRKVADAKSDKHSTFETWNLKQQNADEGNFIPEPREKLAPSEKKPNLFARIKRALFGKK